MGGGTGRTKGRRGGGSGYGERLEDGAAWGRGRRQPGGGKWGSQPGWAPGPQVCTIRFAIKLKIFQPGPPRSCVSLRRWVGGRAGTVGVLILGASRRRGLFGWIRGSLGPPMLLGTDDAGPSAVPTGGWVHLPPAYYLRGGVWRSGHLGGVQV